MVSSQKIEEIIKHLTKAALSDGKITQEESDLLESITVNALIYDRALDDALEDEVITQEEKETLFALKEQLVTEAYDLSHLSDGISDDEHRILRVLLEEVEFEEY